MTYAPCPEVSPRRAGTGRDDRLSVAAASAHPRRQLLLKATSRQAPPYLGPRIPPRPWARITCKGYASIRPGRLLPLSPRAPTSSTSSTAPRHPPPPPQLPHSSRTVHLQQQKHVLFRYTDAILPISRHTPSGHRHVCNTTPLFRAPCTLRRTPPGWPTALSIPPPWRKDLLDMRNVRWIVIVQVAGGSYRS